MGNIQLFGTSEALRPLLMKRIRGSFLGDKYKRERFCASQLGGNAVDMLLQDQNKTVVILY